MKKSACLSILAAGTLWGGIGFFVYHLSALGFQQMQIVFFRVFVAAVAMVPVLFLKGARLFKIKWRDLWCFLGTGICSLLLFNF